MSLTEDLYSPDPRDRDPELSDAFEDLDPEVDPAWAFVTELLVAAASAPSAGEETP